MDVDGLESFLASEAFPGVLDVRRDGEVLFQRACGLASPRWGVPMTPDMRFDVASISKLFTSVAVLQLVGRGLLDLDASIHSYADLAGTTVAPEVTLRHLLTHTSGVGDIAEEDLGETYGQVFASIPCHTLTTTRDFLQLFGSKPPHFAPGAGHRYCNAGYVLAGLAVEHASGRGFREYVEAEVLAVAGMARSAYFDKRYAVADLAEGFDADAQGRLEQNLYAYPPVGAPDGGAFCTASDLHRFLAALRGGVLLPPDLTEQFLTPQIRVDGDYQQGFGLEFDGRRWWKEGQSEGASGIVMHYPGSRTDIVVLASSMRGAWPVVEELRRRV